MPYAVPGKESERLDEMQQNTVVLFVRFLLSQEAAAYGNGRHRIPRRLRRLLPCKWRTWIRHGGFAGWTWAGVLAGFAGALPDEDCDVVGVDVDRLDRAALLSSI